MIKRNTYITIILALVCLVFLPTVAFGQVPGDTNESINNPTANGAMQQALKGVTTNQGTAVSAGNNPSSTPPLQSVSVQQATGLFQGTSITDWSSGIFNNTPPDISANSGTTDFCPALFASDTNNIFRTVFCSLTRIVSLSVADFSSNITCSIQQVGISQNYLNLAFAPDTAAPFKCKVAPTTVFGTKDPNGTASTGIYKDPSFLTQSLVGTSSTTQAGFDITKNLVSIIAFIALMVFAFANILHIDVNTYAIKKALPALIIAIVGAWLSIYVIYVLSRAADFTYQLSFFSPYNVLHPMQNIFGGSLRIPATSGDQTLTSSLKLVYGTGALLVPTAVSFIGGLFGTIILTIPAIIIFIFEYVLALRPYAVQILTVMAPIAFGCLILPQTQRFFRLWWSYLLIAIFYAPIVNFVFYLMNQIASPTAYSASGIALLAIIFFKTAVIAFLIRMPFAFESDIKKITAKVTASSLSNAFGLSKAGGKNAPQKGGQSNPTVTDRILASQEARNLIASPTAQNVRVNLKNVFSAKKTEKLPTDPYLIHSVMPELPQMLEQANKTNLARSAPLLVKSTADISPDSFKAIVGQSDLKLWRDSNLVSQLKNQSGQILDNQGAAIRADSARKLVRLAQTVENGKIANPEALQLLAQKGALNNVPLAVVKKSLQDGVIGKSDLIPTYRGQSDAVFSRLQTLEATSGFSNGATVKQLMVQDQKDYQSGFKDMTKMFSDTIRDPKIVPPPSPDTIKNIVSNMKDSQGNVFEKNGSYFLKRLSEVKHNSTESIASTMQKEGANPQTATAIAKNMRIDFEDSKKYLPKTANPESIALLREGFINRDLSNSLVGEVSKAVLEQKSMLGQSISQKLSEAVKNNPGTGLDKIKEALTSSMQKLQTPASAQDSKKALSEIDAFYPGAMIKTNGEMTADDISEILSHATSVMEVIDALQKGNIDNKTLAENPTQAKDVYVSQVKQQIQNTLSENTPEGAQKSAQINGIAAPAPANNINLKEA
jgi:hypothetical protein